MTRTIDAALRRARVPGRADVCRVREVDRDDDG